MTLEKMRGPYKKLVRRLERAGFNHVAGSGAEPALYYYENATGKRLFLIQTRGSYYVILKNIPPAVESRARG